MTDYTCGIQTATIEYLPGCVGMCVCNNTITRKMMSQRRNNCLISTSYHVSKLRYRAQAPEMYFSPTFLKINQA